MNQQFFTPQPERWPFKDMAELRDALVAAPLDGLEAVNKSIPGTGLEQDLLVRAIRQLRGGCSFDFGLIDLGNAVSYEAFAKTSGTAMAAMVEGVLGIPYDVFVATARLVIPAIGLDALLLAAAEADRHGRLLHCFATSPMINELDGTDFIPLPGICRLGFSTDGQVLVSPAAPVKEDDRLILDFMIQMIFFMLGTLADDRVGIAREAAPERLNRVRRARGARSFRRAGWSIRNRR